MTDTTNTRLHKIATFLINNRYGIVGLFLVITIGMMFAMSQLRIETGFKKQLPLDHEYMQTFLQYEKEFGGANRVLVALVARDGNLFTPEFFEAFETITDQVFFIPGVDRASVRSIFTPNVRFVEIVEDGFAGGNVIPSDYAPSEEKPGSARIFRPPRSRASRFTLDLPALHPSGSSGPRLLTVT